MKSKVIFALSCSFVALATAGCLGVVDPDSTEVVGVHERTGIGDPCVPAIENDPTFASFHESQVVIEDRSRACSSGVCLVNHFRGRVSCPYGDLASGGCQTPRGDVVRPAGSDGVEPQCTDRRAADAVYCSCRCANAEGRTDDGGSYCPCGAGFSCQPLIAFVPGEEKLAGSYCVKDSVPVTAKAACTRTCSPFSGDACE